MASYKRVILQSDNISDLTNDAGYITSVGDITWNSISGKPSIFMHDYATVTGNPVFAGTNTFTGPNTITGNTTFTNVNPIIYSSSAFNGTPKIILKTLGSGNSHLYGGLMLKRDGSSGYNSQLEFQTSIYDNNLRTMMTLKSNGNLNVSGHVNATSRMSIDNTQFGSYNIGIWNEAYSWGDHSTQGYITTSDTAPVANIANRLNVYDTRSNLIPPYNGGRLVRFDFKGNSTDGLNDGSVYHGVMQFNPWGDSSGGKSHQMGFTFNNNIYVRVNSNDSTWGSWSRLAHASEIPSLSGYATLNDPTFVLRINTPQVRFTDSSKTSFNHLNVAQWSTAYSWGNHADAGYLTSETDSQTLSISGKTLSISNGNSITLPTDNNHLTSIRQTGADSTPAGVQFNNAFIAPTNSTRSVYFSGGAGQSSVSTWYGSGNKPYGAIDVSQTYLSLWTNNSSGAWKRMLDVYGDGSLVKANANFQSSGVITASGGDSTSWNQAYGWGNHASAGYATDYGDPRFTSTLKTRLDSVAMNADVTPSWVPNSDPGYLTAVPSSLGATTFTGNVNSKNIINSQQYLGGFGAVTTAGTQDWNDSSNARSGSGYTLLDGRHTNGPSSSGGYYHPFSFEYYKKDGTGNMTQMAIPYLNGNFHYRSRYNGTWNAWRTMIDSGNISSYADKTPSWVPSSDPNYLSTDASNHLTIQGHYYDSGNQKVATENHVLANFVTPTYTGNLDINGHITSRANVYVHNVVASDTIQTYRDADLTIKNANNKKIVFKTNNLERGAFYSNGTFVLTGAIQSGSHHPSGHNTVDLGHSGARWRQIHAANAYIFSLSLTDDLLMTNKDFIRWGGSSGDTRIYGDAGADVMTFVTGGTERARIDNTGLISKSNVWSQGYYIKGRQLAVADDNTTYIKGGAGSGLFLYGMPSTLSATFTSVGTTNYVPVTNMGISYLKRYAVFYDSSTSNLVGYIGSGTDLGYGYNNDLCVRGYNNVRITASNGSADIASFNADSTIDFNGTTTINRDLNMRNNGTIISHTNTPFQWYNSANTSQYGQRFRTYDSGNGGYLTAFGSQRVSTWYDTVVFGNGSNSVNPSLEVKNGIFQAETVLVKGSNASFTLKCINDNYYRTYINDTDHNRYTYYNTNLIQAYSPIVGWDFRGNMSFGGDVNFSKNITVGTGQIKTPAGYNLALNANTGVTTCNGQFQTLGNIISGSHLITSNRLYLDGGSDTYIEESSGNVVDIHNGLLSARFETGRTLFYLPLQPQNDITMLDWKRFKQGSYHQTFVTPVLNPRDVASTAGGPARWEVARIFADTANWNTTGMTKVRVYERYWYGGAWKEFEINFGYTNPLNQGVIRQVDSGGFGSHDNFTVTISGPTNIQNGTANKQYISIFVRSKTYTQVQAHITSTHNSASDWNNSFYGIAYAGNSTNLDAREDSFTVDINAQVIKPFYTSGKASKVQFENDWVRMDNHAQVLGTLYTNNISQNSSGIMTIGDGTNAVVIDGSQLDFRSSGDAPRIKFVDNNGTDCGSIYAHNGNEEIGFLDRGSAWAYKHKHNTHHQWRINNSQRMFLDSDEFYVYPNGSVMLGVTTDGVRAYGTVTATGGNSTNWNTAYGWGDHSRAGYSTGKSDIRLKKDVKTVDKPLEKLSKLRGVDFTWKDTDKKGGGVIAQEVNKVLPDLVEYNVDVQANTVDYNGLIGVLIESVKELKNEVEILKAKCNCKGEK